MSSKLQGVQIRNLIKLPCRVSSFQEDEEKVTVQTADGTAITVDLLVGADGVRSSVRRFIDSLQVERHLESDDCGLVSSEKSVSTNLFLRYVDSICLCIWHLPSDGIMEGDCFSVYREKATILNFTGKGGVVY